MLVVRTAFSFRSGQVLSRDNIENVIRFGKPHTDFTVELSVGQY